jgi:hypothetical protein
MIISDEQARLAAQYLRSRRNANDSGHEAVSADVLAQAFAVVEKTPETRNERVQEAIAHLAMSPDSHEVASKMISRIISDSLR